MISVLGLELERAITLLEAEGYDVECVETRSRKGVCGNEKRVVRELINGKQAQIVYAVFKTNCEFGG